jgi:hypothetical protein
MSPKSVTTGTRPEAEQDASATFMSPTLAMLVRAADALNIAGEERAEILDRQRRQRVRHLDGLARAQRMAEQLARRGPPVGSSPEDLQALELVFRAMRRALVDRASGDPVAFEAALVARAGAVPESLARELGAEMAAALPANRAAVAGHAAVPGRAAPGTASE